MRITNPLVPIVIILLAALDMAFTQYFIVCIGSFELELNPFMRWIMEDFGWGSAYLVRVALPSIGAPVLWWGTKRGNVVARVCLHIALWAHVAITLWHFYSFHQLVSLNLGETCG